MIFVEDSEVSVVIVPDENPPPENTGPRSIMSDQFITSNKNNRRSVERFDSDDTTGEHEFEHSAPKIFERSIDCKNPGAVFDLKHKQSLPQVH